LCGVSNYSQCVMTGSDQKEYIHWFKFHILMCVPTYTKQPAYIATDMLTGPTLWQGLNCRSGAGESNFFSRGLAFSTLFFKYTGFQCTKYSEIVQFANEKIKCNMYLKEWTSWQAYTVVHQACSTGMHEQADHSGWTTSLALWRMPVGSSRLSVTVKIPESVSVTSMQHRTWGI